MRYRNTVHWLRGISRPAKKRIPLKTRRIKIVLFTPYQVTLSEAAERSELPAVDPERKDFRFMVCCTLPVS